MGFATALSGLKSAQTTLSVTGNNISNSQTAGFKESRAQFGDVIGTLGKTAVGSGVRVTNVQQQFKQGNIEATGNALDLAIQGDGFFAMGDLVDPIIPDKPLEATTFTRNGAFHVNNKGNVIDDNGRYLLAFKPTGTTVAEGFDAGVKLPLRIDTDQGSPTATTEISMNLNVNASAQPALTPFAFTTPGTAPYIPDPKTYTHTTSITAYDDQGNAHIVSAYFTRTAVPNQWDMYTFIDGRSIQPGVQEDPYAIPPVPAAGAVALPEGSITNTPTRVVFDTTGNLSSVSAIASTLDTAVANEALAKLKLDVATAKVDSNLTVELNAERTAKNALVSLKSSVEAERTIRQNALNSAKLTNDQTSIDTAQKAFDGIDQTYTALSNIALFSDPSPNSQLKALTDFTTPESSIYDVTVSKQSIKDAFAALGDAVPQAIQQSIDTMYKAQDATKAAIDTVLASQQNSASLKSTHDATVVRLVAEQDKHAQAIAAASAAGKPIAPSPNTKIDFGGVDVSAINPNLKASNLNFSIDLSGSTQFSTPFAVNNLKQDGLPVGSLIGVDVDKAGVVFSKYSNGTSKPIGQVALARFSTNEGLAKVGGTTWRATSESGAPVYGAAGDNNFGQIQSSAIENSNVDLSEQLVKLIVAQQAYQANSQIVGTEKTLVETILRV